MTATACTEAEEQNQVEQLLTPEQVASALQVAKDTLNVWRCTGRHRLPYIKVGATVRYRPSDVADFLRRGTRGG